MMDLIDQYTLLKQPTHSQWDVTQEEIDALDKELIAKGFDFKSHL